MNRLRADDPTPNPSSAEHVSASLAALQPVETLKRRWPKILGAAVTIAMLIGLLEELFGQGLAGLRRAVPASPGFYLFFLLSYFAVPAFEFLIFRRLWAVPPAAFMALNRKRVANDVLIGYSGDAYFYAWASARLKMVAAPFGAVKDVSILSAIAGNLSALVLGAVALPLGYELIEPHILRMILWSLGLAMVLPALFLFFSSRVFSLTRRELWFIFWMELARIAFANVAIALAWGFVIPAVPLGIWMFLVAGRQLVSRLPLVPNKDLLFATFAILIIGHDKALSDLMAFTGASTLAMHLLLTASFGVEYLGERKRDWDATG